MDGNAIDNFLSFCSATGLKSNTVRKYFFDLKTLKRHLGKGLERLSKNDCDPFFSKIENNGYSEATKNHYKLTIRKFLKWKGEIPEFIKPYLKIKNYNIIRPLKFMLTEREKQTILDCCNNLQEKAFFGIVMETGVRADELISTKMEEVRFDKLGGLIIREGKGGTLRRIRIIKTWKLLKKHIYMRKILNPKKKLFDYNYWNVRGILRRLERRSKIGKHLNLHDFRKMAATKLAVHMTEYQLCQVMGWVPGSRMARHYVFLSGRDVDPVLVKVNSGSWS